MNELVTPQPNALPSDLDIVEDDVVVLPWWRNPINLIAIVLCASILSAGVGFVLGERHATPEPNSVDIGFLQDMRTHHEQAVEMSLVMLDKQGISPALRTIAKEIAFGQGIDIGRMIQLLRNFGASEANETELAMTWMNEPVPQERMPGMATVSDAQALRSATGANADSMFVTLMVAHHQGGIHMADYAAANAATDEVRGAAADMSSGQADEIAEMQKLQING